MSLLVYQGCFHDPIRLAACIDMEENAKLVNNVSNSLGGSTNKEKDGNYDEDEEMILVSYISRYFCLSYLTVVCAECSSAVIFNFGNLNIG